MTKMDVSKRRQQKRWSGKEKAGRVVWGLAAVLFRFSPRICWGWRRGLLRAFGAKIGVGVNIHPSCRITIPWNLEIGDWVTIGEDVRLYALGKMVIGERSIISQGAHLCGGTHDHSDPLFPLVKSEIKIEPQAWVCADAFIGPDVSIGESAVVAARAVVMKSVKPGTIVGGNPARKIGLREIRHSI